MGDDEASRERQRQAALADLHILDTAPEPTFDALTDLAAALFDVPIAVITFVDERRQWFKARHGLGISETPRSIAFCAHTIALSDEDVFLVTDAHADPMFSANPLVTGEPHIRFYAGARLRLASGISVGSLAIIDRTPRTLDDASRARLVRMAHVVVDAIETRLRGVAAERERSRSDAQAARQERRSTAIFEAALDAIVLADAAGTILGINPAAERMFKRPRAEAIGARVVDVIVPASLRAAHEGAWNRHLATGESRMLGKRLDLHAVDADGREFPVELTVVRIPEEPPLFAAFVRDLTERRALEAQLLQAQKMEAVGRLAAGVAHDFNNLLAIIVSYADLATPRVANDAELRRDVDEIRQAALQGRDLTKQLLAFARPQDLAPDDLDVDELARRVATMVRPALGARVDVALDLASAPTRVRADRARLEQAVVNLALNARDAMPNGGTLTIETRRVGIDDHATAPRPGAYVSLVVADTGVGIDAASKARIFEPFFTTKERGKGSGLGLATVFATVRQSGGTIVVESEPGKGARFEILLPAADA